MSTSYSTRTGFGAWRRRDYLLAVGCLYLLYTVSTLVHQELRLQRYTADLSVQRQTVHDEQRDLQRQIALYNKSEGIEKLARRHLGLGRADEVPVRFVNGNSLVSESSHP